MRGWGGLGLFVALLTVLWRRISYLARVYVWRGEWACHANGFRWRKWSRKSLWLVAEAFYWSGVMDTKNCFSKTRPAAGQNMAAICLISLLIQCSKQMCVCVCGGTTLISWNECLLSIDCIFDLFISSSEIDSYHWLVVSVSFSAASSDCSGYFPH